MRGRLILVGDVGALTGNRAHPVTVGRPYTVIVRVLWEVRGGLGPWDTATAAQRVHTGLIQNVVMHEIGALPCWRGHPVADDEKGIKSYEWREELQMDGEGNETSGPTKEWRRVVQPHRWKNQKYPEIVNELYK